MRLNAITLICILLLIGAAGKSAQIGSHTWSPDAMEGPTPVSALIHAATMVTAGVFMIARCSPLFEYPPTALIVITFAGAMTSFLAATTRILQNDLKRVIAYSTCSQLGYMIFSCGISNYSVSVFYLMNHAFFKALLFLSAGIDNAIYSTVNACPNACEMWKAIERLKHGESINVQDLETNLYWEFGKFTSQDGESLESYYLRFYKMMNELIKNQCKVTNHQVNV
nr:NADH dehydrogenase subunit 5, mitochondrial [Tanacetum cinerariifolium]